MKASRIAPGKSDTEQRIVEAATKLFSHQGFAATSTREIARLADVTESSIFRYFETKEELFRVTIESRLQRLRVGKELEAALSADARPELVLPLTIDFLVKIVTYEPELIRLLHFAALEMRPVAERFYRQELTPIVRSITTYMERAIKRGALRQVDPFITTLGFLATILSHQGMHELLLNSAVPYVNTEQAVEAYSKFWLQALMPAAAVRENLADTQSGN